MPNDIQPQQPRKHRQSKQENSMRDKSATQTETESSSRVPNHDEDWEVVAKQEVDGRSPAPDSSPSMHFDVTLGWGQRKHTLFSFDYTQSSEYAGDDDDRTGGAGDFARDETRQSKSAWE